MADNTPSKRLTRIANTIKRKYSFLEFVQDNFVKAVIWLDDAIEILDDEKSIGILMQTKEILLGKIEDDLDVVGGMFEDDEEEQEKENDGQEGEGDGEEEDAGDTWHIVRGTLDLLHAADQLYLVIAILKDTDNLKDDEERMLSRAISLLVRQTESLLLRNATSF